MRKRGERGGGVVGWGRGEEEARVGYSLTPTCLEPYSFAQQLCQSRSQASAESLTHAADLRLFMAFSMLFMCEQASKDSTSMQQYLLQAD